MKVINVSGLKLKKRSGIWENYKASCTFDPNTLQAYSYNWWLFVTKIGGKVVFNNYTYSNCTSKHQSKVRQLLGQLGVNVDVTIEAPQGLQDLPYAIENYERRIVDLKALIAKPRTLARKNAERLAEVKRIEKSIKVIQKLIREVEFKNKLENL